jgi:hypothetical protein
VIGDFLLGLRLAVGGSRSSGAVLLRLAMTTIGIALVVTVLLPAASIGNVVNARADRVAGMVAESSERPEIDPLYEVTWYAKPHGQYVVVHAVAASGPATPVPPGLSALPGPGELVVSPAVAEQLNSPGGGAFRDRLSGRVVGVIGKPGLGDANDLAVWAGAPLGELRTDPAVEAIYGFGKPSDGFSVNASLIIILLPVLVGLLLPLLVFVTTASRMGAAQRDRRLAALRLIGVDARQIHRVAAAESLLGALAGVVAGGILFVLLRPWLGSLNLFGIQVFADDFTPPWLLVALIVVLVPGLAIGAALFGLRHTIVEPLGVVRQGRQARRRMGWRWTITGVGAVLLAFSAYGGSANADDGVLIALTAGCALLLVGVAVLLPWLVERVANRLHGGPPSWQFAVSRLQVDSGTSSRVVSGLVVVLAGAIMIQVLLSSTATVRADQDTSVVSRASVPVSVDTSSQRQSEVLTKIRAVPGIDRAEAVQSFTAQYADGRQARQYVQVEIGSCAALALRANLGSCTDGDVFAVDAPAGQVRVTSHSGRPEGPLWTIPSTVRHLATGQAAEGVDVLATTKAVQGLRLPGDRVTVYVGGQGTVEELSDRVSAAVSSLGWQAVSSLTDLSQSTDGTQDAAMRKFRAPLLAASVFVLMVAALSLLILSVEQITERRRALAALSAAGVPFGVLARTSFWQTALPMGIGLVLAVGAGIGLSTPILGIAGISLSIDPAVIAGLAGAAVLAVLLVTACTLPLLRQATRVESLRAE